VPIRTVLAGLRPLKQIVGHITESDEFLIFSGLHDGYSYGSFVRQLLVDYEEPLEVNSQLETMGYNIGVRLVDDFFAKSKISAYIRYIIKVLMNTISCKFLTELHH
jgi:hypothetical protein